MALTYTDINQSGGGPYIFGFQASDAPTIVGFTARNVASLDRSPEVFETAINGEGHVEAVAISKAANKMISAEFTGYITAAFNSATVASTFTFLGRFFFIKKISDPRPKGKFVEVAVTAESYPLVTS